MGQMIRERTLKLWTLADDKAEFKRHHRLIEGSLKSGIDDQKVRQCLHEVVTPSLADTTFAIALHDPCDIRKPYSNELEYLGQVRSLDGSIVNGYNTFNTALCTGSGASVHPFDITVYSNGHPSFVTQKELSHLNQDDWSGWADEERALSVETLVQADAYHNMTTIRRDQLIRVSQTLKATHPDIVIRHVLDREHDDNDLFIYIDQELQDQFIIRMKLSRNSAATTKNSQNQDVAIKLKDVDFKFGQMFGIPKLLVKRKAYQNARCCLEWQPFEIDDQAYHVVRITLFDRYNNMIFGEPMLLITNAQIKTFEQALAIYHHYLLRAKIEGIFKFLKSMLGWEEFQIRDFVPIKNLLVVGFYIAAYFYELESELTQSSTIKWIATLGGAKNGETTRHFIVKGFAKILTHNEVENFKNKNPIPDDLLSVIAQLVI